MQIQMRPTEQVRPYEHNPRVNDAAVDAVARSLRPVYAAQLFADGRQGYRVGEIAGLVCEMENRSGVLPRPRRCLV